MDRTLGFCLVVSGFFAVALPSLLAGEVGAQQDPRDRFQAAVLAAFRSFRPESLYHLGLSKHYTVAARTAFQALVERYPQHAWTKQAQEKAQ